MRVATVIDPSRHDALAHDLRGRLRRTGNALVSLGDEQLWQTADSEPVAWRTATVADLLRGGALALYRATPTRETALSDASEPPPVLTHHDVRTGGPPSGSLYDKPVDKLVPIKVGDVLLPEMLHHASLVKARIASKHEAGSVIGLHLFFLRPDPERLDSDFLAGFLSVDQNIHGGRG
ncbi:hypothetical protein [Amycolatopsis sp. NPDC051071]|uniref:hypothetical protein n=1 Tax=Amycolatopsis sp. NPDC051071 TaxID=3154637 RepID=UPI003425CF3B